jgi:hypothetical protein
MWSLLPVLPDKASVLLTVGKLRMFMFVPDAELLTTVDKNVNVVHGQVTKNCATYPRRDLKE